jgi:hypothetical protein
MDLARERQPRQDRRAKGVSYACERELTGNSELTKIRNRESQVSQVSQAFSILAPIFNCFAVKEIYPSHPTHRGEILSQS